MKRERKGTINLVQNSAETELQSASRLVMAGSSAFPSPVTNPLGKKLLGGQVMHLVDYVAAMAASRHSLNKQ